MQPRRKYAARRQVEREWLTGMGETPRGRAWQKIKDGVTPSIAPPKKNACYKKCHQKNGSSGQLAIRRREIQQKKNRQSGAQHSCAHVGCGGKAESQPQQHNARRPSAPRRVKRLGYADGGVHNSKEPPGSDDLRVDG